MTHADEMRRLFGAAHDTATAGVVPGFGVPVIHSPLVPRGQVFIGDLGAGKVILVDLRTPEERLDDLLAEHRRALDGLFASVDRRLTELPAQLAFRATRRELRRYLGLPS